MPNARPVPEIRIRPAHDADVRPAGDFVLYWMIANRRLHWNYTLDRALEWSNQLSKPLIVLEALRADYRWASDRFHAFVIQGMRDNQASAAGRGIRYYPYLEPVAGAGRGLLKALAAKAAVVVSDDFPCFFMPAMLRAAARQVPCKFELVDSNGMLPMRAAPKVFSRAYDFRRFLQKQLPVYLEDTPQSQPLQTTGLAMAQIPHSIVARWPTAKLPADTELASSLREFPIDHQVTITNVAGGTSAAREQLNSFIDDRLRYYGERRNDADDDVASGLSPYLHFGHISAHQVFNAIVAHESWTLDGLSPKANGSSTGWWGMSPSSESFLDELITWRELGYNLCSNCSNYDRYESLPQWAQSTLEEHQVDRREHVYAYEELEQAQTHDRLWNAAQTQLVQSGKIHNYLRMLWGKKILEWSNTPRDALQVMLELNNKYALDGRNPNSYSGIFWVLGRYDRAWGPERPIFGKIRYMSSENTARKMSVKRYLERWQGSLPSRQTQLFDT